MAILRSPPRARATLWFYIAAMPGWKGDVGRRLNALIVKTTPGVRKAVKWNSPPLYGVEVGALVLGIHCFAEAESGLLSRARR